MGALKKYQLNGQQVGEETVDDAFFDVSTNHQMVKDYIVALRKNARQWSANTKGRSEVSHSTQKPHRQKGMGRARQGSLVAPQYRGGGRVFGPKPKFDQFTKINRKEKRQALRQLLAEKMREDKIIILADPDSLQFPKTKTISHFLKQLDLREKRVLFLAEGNYETIPTEEGEVQISVKEEKHQAIAQSIRNIPKVEFSLAANINGYELLLANTIVMTEPALRELTKRLG